MIYSIVGDEYEVSIYKSLDSLSKNVLDVDPANFLEISGSRGKRVEIFNESHFKKLMKGITRAYIYPDECGGDWVYKISRH